MASKLHIGIYMLLLINQVVKTILWKMCAVHREKHFENLLNH